MTLEDWWKKINEIADIVGVLYRYARERIEYERTGYSIVNLSKHLKMYNIQAFFYVITNTYLVRTYSNCN